VKRSLSLPVALLVMLAASACGSQPQRPAAGCAGSTRRHAVARTVAGVPAFTHPTRYPIVQSSGDPYYPVGRAVAIGDLNGDGAQDLAAVNPAEESASLTVLLNRGDGSFDERHDYGTGRGPNAVAIADVDCDGTQDLVTANGHAKTVSVLLNRGNGRFERQHAYRASDMPWAVAVADLDGDGYRDLAVANLSESGSVSVLLNEGNGSFGEPTNYPTKGGFPMDLSALDDNGDGRIDLAVANSEGKLVYLLQNRGGGRFEPGRQYDYGTSNAALAAGDLNGDGKKDLALVWTDTSDEIQEEGVTLEPSYVKTLLSQGDGSFTRPRLVYEDGGYSEGANAPTVADLDGDGHADLVVPRLDQDSGIVSLFQNDGSGRLRDKARVDYPLGGGQSADAIAVGDLNGDGVADLVNGNFESSTLSVFLGLRGRCTVQDVSGATLHVYELNVAAAARALARGGCRVGTITARKSKYDGTTKGRVFAQRPAFGAVLPAGSKVDLVVAR
jgi:FG-GAP-like repeat/PASTA domain/FG-GAP repeat